MTNYISYSVNLTDCQKRSLQLAYTNNEALIIRLSINQLQGFDTLMLTKTQINKIKKAIKTQKGVNINISKTQIRKVIKKGGSLFSALFSKIIPLATKHILPGLMSGATTGLASNVVDKIFGRGFTVPYTNLPQLYDHSKLLTPKQKTDLTKSLKTGSGLQITPTISQSGGFLGTLLASIGIPMVLKALTGNGMQIEPYRGSGMQIEPYRGGSKKKNMMKYQTGEGLIIGNY